jgi:hypothetical protein
MTTPPLRLALAFMLAGAVVLGVTDGASAYRKPKARVLVEHPYVPPGVLNERECVTRTDSRGVPLPYYMYCDAAFRRLYSR